MTGPGLTGNGVLYANEQDSDPIAVTALTQNRHYRRGMSSEDAFQVIQEMVPHALDQECVAALKAFLGCGTRRPA